MISITACIRPIMQKEKGHHGGRYSTMKKEETILDKILNKPSPVFIEIRKVLSLFMQRL